MTPPPTAAAAPSEQERKRQRLEAWRSRNKPQQPQPKVRLQLLNRTPAPKDVARKRKKKKRQNAATVFKNPLADDDGDDDGAQEETTIKKGEPHSTEESAASSKKRALLLEEPSVESKEEEELQAIQQQQQQPKRKKKKRWDAVAADKEEEDKTKKDIINSATTTSNNNKTNDATNYDGGDGGDDALEQFMDQLQAGAVAEIQVAADLQLRVDVSGSVMRSTHHAHSNSNNNNNNNITADQLLVQQSKQQQQQPKKPTDSTSTSTPSIYQPSDWLSDAAPTPGTEDREDDDDDDDDTEEEQQKRRALIEALTAKQETDAMVESATTAVVVSKTALKSRQTQQQHRLQQLKQAAERVQKLRNATVETGRVDDAEGEDGIWEEEAVNYWAAQQAPDALHQFQAALNKKKELSSAKHDAAAESVSIVKNLYRVPRALQSLTHDDVVNRRARLRVRVRGHGVPCPVETFAQTGLPEVLLRALEERDNIAAPYPVQAQCVPAVLAGRDVIGIAKTGSGKTLAYVLPMLRHITVQPELSATAPMALILAPARELAFQIHSVTKSYAKLLGLKCTAVYGGAGVAEQIADLKRGTHIVTATPGRLIDILTMSNGPKILSLRRITFVVIDEADRIFDCGFEPQISAILSAIRPDRQTVLFSATFPKAIEKLARERLHYPVEVVVGGRSVASDSVTQYAELVEEPDKFLRLLQILGEQLEGTKKAIVFVDTQVRADSLFEQLLRNGYSTLSLHGGKEQEDRDSAISDFKRKDGPNVLVATGVAGRGLDVSSCTCVVNFSAPNHLEAYVHQCGRTGRAGNRGVCYTLVNSGDEAKFAPIVTRALNEAGQGEHIDPALKQLSDDFKLKVEKGEARYAGSGFKGKGYTYDSNEMNEAQRMAKLEKRQALIEAGLLDPDEDDPLLNELKEQQSEADDKKKKEAAANAENKVKTLEIPDTLTPELLALPGMKEALLRKAGIVPTTEETATTTAEDDLALGRPVRSGDNHWVQEFEINDYPREARWKVTQKDTTSRMQDEFRTAVTLKGSYFPPGKEPAPGERKIYLHLEATSETILRNAVLEIQRLLNEETLRVSAKTSGGASRKYNVLG